MKISVLTLGCKVNQAESSLIKGTLKSIGHEIVDVVDKPDVCIMNTCTVTAKSDYQSRQLIRRAHREGRGYLLPVVFRTQQRVCAINEGRGGNR